MSFLVNLLHPILKRVNITPIQVEGKLHVLDFPTIEDIQNLIDNGADPDNVRMLQYWMQLWNDKAHRLGIIPLAHWDDTVFLGAIAWMWFLRELKEDSKPIAVDPNDSAKR